jgi:hypothetical protein
VPRAARTFTLHQLGRVVDGEIRQRYIAVLNDQCNSQNVRMPWWASE